LALFAIHVSVAISPLLTKVYKPDWSLKQQYNSTSLQREWVDPKNKVPSTPVVDNAGLPRPVGSSLTEEEYDTLFGNRFTPPSTARSYTTSSSATSTSFASVNIRLAGILLAFLIHGVVLFEIFKRNFTWTLVLVMINTVLFIIAFKSDT
jgi:hypothetical protein